MMKHLLKATVALCLFASFNANAQCIIKPVVAPANVLLCPNTQDSLYTTKVYDTYQWFKNGKAILGATSRYVKIDQYQDAGSLWTVSVTKDSCAGTSAKRLVDGWAFASPITIGNTIPNYVTPVGVGYYCPTDSMTLTFGLPYNTNIQWYNNGKPIAGATEQTYHVTSDGAYTVCGSPEVCPDFTQCQGLAVVVKFDTIKAEITRSGDTLIATASARKYQWSVGGKEIAGATSRYYFPTKRGLYTVSILDKILCPSISKPFLYTGGKSGLVTVSPNPAKSYINVCIKSDEASQIIISDVYGNKRLQVPVKGTNQRVEVASLSTGAYVIHVLDKLQNVIATAKFVKE